MLDAFGTEIKVGDVVVHAGRQSSNMWLNKLRVIAVTETTVQGYSPQDMTQRLKTLKQNKTIAVLETCKGDA